MSAVIKNSTSITMYIPVGLKLRIEKAAQDDQRSVSQYMTRILERLVPPIDQQALQVDIESLISEQNLSTEKAERVRKAVRRVTKKPRRAK
jgi:RNase H-fold protein (predicted Holliday junction resolvase)